MATAVCKSCRQVKLRMHMHVDHRKSLGLGGADKEWNKQPLCLECHNAKTRVEARVLHPVKRKLGKVLQQAIDVYRLDKLCMRLGRPSPTLQQLLDVVLPVVDDPVAAQQFLVEDFPDTIVLPTESNMLRCTCSVKNAGLFQPSTRIVLQRGATTAARAIRATKTGKKPSTASGYLSKHVRTSRCSRTFAPTCRQT